MKRLYLIIIACWAMLTMVSAQKLTVESMAVAGNDISASKYERKDLNDQACALVKVLLASPGAQFEGNVIQPVDYKTGEYWVYMTAGAKELRIKHPQAQPIQVIFKDFGIEKVTAKSTYTLSVLLPGSESNVKQQFTIRYTPQDAIVIIDSKPYQGQQGVVTALLPTGQHDYLVTASGYEPVDGSIRLKAAAPTTIRIDLEKTQNVTGSTNIQQVVTRKEEADEEIKGLTTEQIRILGYDYIYGENGKQVDYAKALHYSRIAAERGDAKAIHNVGYLYMNGYGVAQDYDEAYKWIRKSAELGSVAGQCNLGFLYYYGNGVTQDYAEAYKWFKKGADQGDVYSIYWVGFCYEQGHGVTKSLTEALKWYKKAADLGYEDAKEKISKLSPPANDVSNTNYNGTALSPAIESFTVNGVSFKMIRVDGGTFTMGEQGSDAFDWERPTHQVTLSTYSIGEAEVTQALWQAVMGKNPSKFKGDNLPVEKVSWEDCQTFISKLNELTGKQFRLPTEAEWEYAARGGNKSHGYKYSGSNDANDVTWFVKTTNDKGTRPVKTKQSNELGLYDMSGNVMEWCQDWYGSYSSSSQKNPTGASSGDRRVWRGGSWLIGARSCRPSGRGGSAPSLRRNDIGLRLAL